MDATQFDALYRRHYVAIAKFFARRTESNYAEELAAETFSIAWTKKHQVKHAFELAWLYKIAGFVLNNHRRRVQKDFRFLSTYRPAERFAPSAEQLALKDSSLAEAVLTLSPRDQSILALVYLDELPIKDAASILQVTPNTVSLRLIKIRTTLASRLEVIERLDHA